MAQQRGAADAVKEPHSVSLKVLRLSRPSLSLQHPLPTPPSSSQDVHPSQTASLAYPSTTPTPFILSPLLTLPPSFGSAYVGETFSCTLCANNEIPASTASKTISSIRIEAEMKIPSQKLPIPLVLGPDTSTTPDQTHNNPVADLPPSSSHQRIVSYPLKEEGSHVLAVTVTYHESTPTSGRVRTFRKLYQFTSKGCMVVRTKTGPLPSSSLRKWALEAQLENVGEETIVLDKVILETTPGFVSEAVNWDGDCPVLGPGDVEQVCFVVQEIGDGEEVTEEEKERRREKEVIDGKLIFGILSLGWRGAMGNRGFLSTGSLGARI
ncbi:hypothetical protein GLAREA_09043 [Glarea lozoyensis ATCC 20868]|uniref:Trafficking protein particle complex subunit 13 n=1 Tax=Glarea lozoyensis (strain ATCC 20868 / MF5171) TaxID=1116229 RepID=S3DGR7_GLAL2|nr:uncharacterized protein GLAREA_09043 [Glarea lozoyensis ATCC 20868]EPE36880.1 hypothetical protein GLAREA_09043 [Glarea lozoyensis ATCC 20868]